MLSNSSYKFKRGTTMEKRIIQGIGLIVLTPDKKILVIEEMKYKPILEKKAGMLSFPMETMEKKETPEATLERLLYEEIFGGGDISLEKNLSKPILIDCQHFFFCGGKIKTKLLVYLSKSKIKFTPTPFDKDIRFWGWENIPNLCRLNLRVEAKRSLLSFMLV